MAYFGSKNTLQNPDIEQDLYSFFSAVFNQEQLILQTILLMK